MDNLSLPFSFRVVAAFARGDDSKLVRVPDVVIPLYDNIQGSPSGSYTRVQQKSSVSRMTARSRAPRGFQPNAPRECMVLASLTPGLYTAVVRGKNDTTGIALVEAYNLP
jgi:hypothetical protein